MTENQVVKQTPESLAKLRAGLDVQGNPNFALLLTSVANAQKVVATLRVENAEQYRQTSRVKLLVLQLKEDIEDWEKLLLGASKLYTDTVKGMLKPMKMAVKTITAQVDKPLLNWIDHVRTVTEASEKAEKEMGVVEVGAGVPAPTGEAPLPTAPAVEGVTIFKAEEMTVNVVDPMALLKAIVSKDNRNAIYTHELVEFKVAKLKAFAREKGARIIPGVEVKTNGVLRARRKRAAKK